VLAYSKTKRRKYMTKDKKIGFIGAGTMAKAIISGLINSGAVSVENIIASEINETLAAKAAEILGVKVITDNKEVAKNSDILFLCVKPYGIIESVMYEIKEFITEKKLIVSIAAGVSTDFIETSLENKTRIPVIRVMPNTPAVINEGMSAICKGRFATEEQADLILELFNNIGRAIKVPERLINAVTGISGSGPAFVFSIIEALADGGLKLGLTKQVALELAAQTCLGAAKMVLETGKHPSVLKDEVTTPGGCTIAGLLTMEEEKVPYALSRTVIETAKAAGGLGKKDK
jgi:pyrroline-5-carboxylate reductase